LADFDKFAGKYREIHDDNLKSTGFTSAYFSERKIKEIAAREGKANCKKNLNILDLGCGDGLGAFYIREHFPESFVCGLDISAENIKVAQSKRIENAEFKHYDGKAIPYSAESFDIILMVGVLHHITAESDRLSVLKEARHVMKPNGTLYVFEHNTYNPLTRKIVDECVFDKQAKLIGPGEIGLLLEKAGLRNKLKYIIFFPSLFKWLVFLEQLLWWLPLGGQYYCICKKHNLDISGG
jgi:ubiquinone/menaquinone biosynthesis C-methylase UbiE